MPSPQTQSNSTARSKGTPSAKTSVTISKKLLSMLKMTIVTGALFATAMYYGGAGTLLEGCQVNYQPEVCYTGIPTWLEDTVMGVFIAFMLLCTGMLSLLPGDKE